MVRALILLAAAVVVALLPGPRLIRGVAVVILVAAAGVVGYFVETETVERIEHRQEERSSEEARWSPPSDPGVVSVVTWSHTAPFRFSEFWAVDGTAGLRSPRSGEITGIELTVQAYDCPNAAAPVASCTALGSASARGTFNPIGPRYTRQLRLRFRFDDAPAPRSQLRLLPSVSAIRL